MDEIKENNDLTPDERVHKLYSDVYKDKRWVRIDWLKSFIKEWEIATGKLKGV